MLSEGFEGLESVGQLDLDADERVVSPADLTVGVNSDSRSRSSGVQLDRSIFGWPFTSMLTNFDMPVKAMCSSSAMISSRAFAARTAAACFI